MKFFTPIILLGLSIGAFYLYINPTYKSIKVLRAESAQYAGAVKEAKEASVIWNDLVNRSDSMNRADLDRLEKMLPDKVDNIKLLNDLNTMALKYGTGISNIRLTEPTSESNLVANSDPYSSLHTNFSVSMTYSNFVNFLRDMGKSLRLADIEKIDFKPSDDSPLYTFTLTTKTYWLK